MSDRIAIGTHSRFRYSTRVIGIATLLTALGMFFAASVDVGAMLPTKAAGARSNVSAAFVLPREWIWRGPKPIPLDSMYGNSKPSASDSLRMPDWIRTHHDECCE